VKSRRPGPRKGYIEFTEEMYAKVDRWQEKHYLRCLARLSGIPKSKSYLWGLMNRYELGQRPRIHKDHWKVIEQILDKFDPKHTLEHRRRLGERRRKLKGID